MSKISLTPLVNLTNQTTAVNAINANSTVIQTAFDNTLSRDGTSPNSMGANLDMNSHKILNLPAPTSGQEPVRLVDLNSFTGGPVLIEPIPAGGLAGQVLAKASNANYDTVWNSTVSETRVTNLETEVSILQTAQTGSGIGFASNTAMLAAVNSYPVGTVAYNFDGDPTLSGIYLHQAGASWGSRVSLLPTDATNALFFSTDSFIPSPFYGAVVIYRLTSTDWIVRTPIVGNAGWGEYTEFRIKDIGPALGQFNIFTLAGIATNERGIKRIQSDYNLHGSVFEYAFNIGLMGDALNSGFWNYYGNGHDHVTYTGSFISMDGGGNIRLLPIGTAVFGTSLSIVQTFDIRLPKDDVTVVGNISSNHIFTASGCLVQVSHTITAPNIGNQNSYSAMLPLTGCNIAKFGSSPNLPILLYNGSQSAPQGQQSTIQAWHTERPDLIAEMILPTGNPGSPDGWSNVTTSDTFAINQVGYTKLYVNYRSGVAAVLANNSSHQTQYRVRKT